MHWISIAPIVASLRKHKINALLLVLQSMLVFAIVSNVLNVVAHRMSDTSAVSGVDENSVLAVDVQSVDPAANWDALHNEAIARLREIPGVLAVAVVDTLPLGGSESTFAVCSSLESLSDAARSRNFDHSGCMLPAVLYGGRGELAALGLQLVAGRDFQPDEYVDKDVASAILSESLAHRLFPGSDAIGQVLYSGAGAQHPIRVVGIVRHLLRPKPRDAAHAEDTMLWPMLPNESGVIYVLRASPAESSRVLRSAVAALRNVDAHLIIQPGKVRAFGALRADYYRRDLALIGTLLMAVAALLFVAAAGVAGLARFWVRQRTRSVGVRRALGATRKDILGYFLGENLLLMGLGIALGIPLAYGVNLALLSSYGADVLSVWLLIACAMVLLVLGQMAAFAPAYRAAGAAPIDCLRYRG